MALNSIIISDSTTLISLINIERFELLFKFSDTIIITPSVYSEVTVQKSAKRILDDYISHFKVLIFEVKNEKKVVNGFASSNDPSSQYATGRKISKLISWVGWFTIVGVIYVFIVGGHTFHFFEIISALITGFFGLFLVATGQVMLAIMDNADNTSKIVRLLGEQAK